MQSVATVISARRTRMQYTEMNMEREEKVEATDIAEVEVSKVVVSSSLCEPYISASWSDGACTPF